MRLVPHFPAPNQRHPERLLHIHDLNATTLHLLGVDHTRLPS